MKQRCILFLLLFMAGNYASAQFSGNFGSDNVNSIQPVIEEGLKLAAVIEERDPQAEILKLEFDLAHDDNYTTLDLTGGITYVFGVFSDDRIEELSLIIYQEDKRGKLTKLYEKSRGGDNETLRIEIPETGHYKIDVRIDKLKNEHELGHFGLIVCELLEN